MCTYNAYIESIETLLQSSGVVKEGDYFNIRVLSKVSQNTLYQTSLFMKRTKIVDTNKKRL